MPFCNINMNNLLSGRNQSSLSAYLLGQLQFKTGSSVLYGIKAQAENYNPEKLGKDNNKPAKSDYFEPSVLKDSLFRVFDVPKETQDYIRAVEKFFIENNINPYEYISRDKVLEILQKFDKESPFSIMITQSREKDSYGLYTIKPVFKSEKLDEKVDEDIQRIFYNIAMENSEFDPSVFNKNAQFFTAGEPILSDIIDKILVSPDINEETKSLLQRILPALSSNPDLKINFEQGYTYGYDFDKKTGKLKAQLHDNFSAFYFASKNQITFSIPDLSIIDPNRFTQVLIHEIIHSLFEGILVNPQTKEEQQLVDELFKLREKVSKLFTEEQIKSDIDLYGLSSSSEFLAEFLSNPRFRKLILENSETKESIIDWIKRALTILFNKFRDTKKPLRTPKTNLELLTEDILKSINESGEINRTAIETQYELHYAIAFRPEDLNAMDQALSNNSQFLSQINEFLDRDTVSWNKILQEAKRIGISEDKIKRTEDLYKQINRVDPVEAFKSLTSYLHETALYLNSFKKTLNSINVDPKVSLHEKFTKGFHARELAKYYKDMISDLEETFTDSLGNTFAIDTILGRQVENIKAYINSLDQDYYPKAINAISEKLAEQLAPQTQSIKNKLTTELEKLEKELTLVGPKLKPIVQEKIKQHKETLKKIATPENLRNAFKKEIQDINFLSQYLEAARLSDNIIVASVGTFISNLYDEANAEAISMEVEVKKLANRWESYQKSKGKQALTSLHYEDFFNGLYKKVTIKEIHGNELVSVDTIVLNSEMDEISYLNDKTELRHKILLLEQEAPQTRDQNKLDSLKQELKDMEDTYEVDKFTPEWHRIQGLLSPEARAARNEIIENMMRIQTTASDASVTEEELDQLEELKFQLERLESDYDENNNLKDEEGLRIAKSIRDWKKEKNANNLYTFEVSEEKQIMFDHHYELNEQNYALAQKKYQEALATQDTELINEATKKLQAQKKQYDLWKRANTSREISKDFYKQRRAIIDRISAIQTRYEANLPSNMRKASEVFEDIFNILKGYKDNDNIYQGNKVPEVIGNRVKELQDELDNIQEAMKDLVDGDDYGLLRKEFEDLRKIQVTVKTPYYTKTLNEKIAQVRYNIIDRLTKEGEPLPSQEALNRLANIEIKKTDWYKSNHRLVWKWDGQKSYQEYEPIFIWTVKEPRDESLITSANPSFRWKGLVINPAFINKQKDEMRSVNRVALKPEVSKYRNLTWANLSDTEKGILTELTNVYLEHQKTIPKNLRKGLELPAIQKSPLEMANTRISSISSQMSSVVGNLVDSLTFKYSEDTNNPEDSEGPVTSRHSRRLYLKYSNRIGQDRMSINPFNSITQFNADMIRFRKGYEQMPYIFGIQDVLEKNKKGTRIAQAIDALVESRLQGKKTVTWSNNKILSGIEGALNQALSFGSYTGLALRLPSTIKNQLAGTTNIMFQLKGYGLDQSDFHKAGLKNMKEYYTLYRSYLEDGIDSLYIQKVRYFNIMPEDHITATGKNLFVSDSKKWFGTFNPIKHLEFLRTFGEFEMRSAAAEALSNKFYKVELKNGNFISLMDAYQMVDGKITPRADIKDLETFKALENHFRNQLNAINSLIHGQYSTMDKGEYSRYTIGRLLMFMKGGWLYQQSVRRFGGKRLSYSGGFEYEGFYRTMVKVAYQLIRSKKDFKYVFNNVLSQREKADFLTGVYETMTMVILYSVLAGLNALRYSDSDDEEDKWALYEMLYTLSLLEDELSTLNPVAGSVSIWYSRFYNNVDGTDAPTYYASKEFWLPFKSSVDLIKTGFGLTAGNLIDLFANTNLGFNPFNEYVPLSRNGKVLNPKMYPPDPTISGMNEFTARTLRMVGLDATLNSLINPEYIFRKYEKRNPRWYIESLDQDLKNNKSQINSMKKQIKSLERQKDYISDEATKEDLQESINDLRTKIKEAGQERQNLENENYTGLR